MLFHVSEERDIARFDPRDSEIAREPVVWAIDSRRLRNYQLPRECSRVTYPDAECATASLMRFIEKFVPIGV